MNGLESSRYPELSTRLGMRDRPLLVEHTSSGPWRVQWRSGRATAYERDPRTDLGLGYEPAGAREVPL